MIDKWNENKFKILISSMIIKKYKENMEYYKLISKTRLSFDCIHSGVPTIPFDGPNSLAKIYIIWLCYPWDEDEYKVKMRLKSRLVKYFCYYIVMSRDIAMERDCIKRAFENVKGENLFHPKNAVYLSFFCGLLATYSSLMNESSVLNYLIELSKS